MNSWDNHWYNTVSRTINPALTREQNICNGLMGLIEEWDEYQIADCDHFEGRYPITYPIKEAGDVFWYMQLLSRTLGLSPPQYVDLGATDAPTWLEHDKLVGPIKKHLFQGHDLDALSCFQVSWQLSVVYSRIIRDLGRYNVTLDQILEANAVKLAARYPDGFVANRSINR